MIISSFSFSGTPELIFKSGRFDELSWHIKKYDDKVLQVTGKSSFKNSSYFDRLINKLEELDVVYYNIEASNEPSPDKIDDITEVYRKEEDIFMKKHARTRVCLSNNEHLFFKEDGNNIESCCKLLIYNLESWQEKLDIPRLNK